MRRSVLILLALYVAVSSAIISVAQKGRQIGKPSVIRCWKCENEDLKGCKRRGVIEKCQAGVRQTCQTEVRYSEDQRRPLIKTGCKQGIACSSNKIQNRGAAWSPTQCDNLQKNSVCRCCCIGSMCNKRNKNLLCKYPLPVEIRPDAPKAPGPLAEERSCGDQPNAPNNGKKQCSGYTGPRSFCRFKCDRGFKMEGPPVSICGRVGAEYLWNNPTPTCLKEEICMTLPERPENGFKTCIGNGQVGSRCFFVCDRGYKMYGPPSVTCKLTESGARWSFEPPTCKIVVCDPQPQVPKNGDYECTGIGELGTSCYFTCDVGYDLIGHEYTVCEREGKWNNPTPTCKEVRCSFLPRTPRNGIKECTSDGALGTECCFSCNGGYQLNGYSSIACHRVEGRRGMAKWDNPVPTCEPMCDTLSEGPENGYSYCEGIQVGDKCKYHCEAGFEIRGSKTTECKMGTQGAKWSDEVPICEPVCKPLRQDSKYGKQTCLGSGNIGTSCMYACNDGFRLKTEIVCKAVEHGADWTAPVPTCIPVCHPEPAVENGFTSCEGNGEVGSVCVFACNEGYRLKGASKVTCEFHSIRAAWSDKPPYCEHFNPYGYGRYTRVKRCKNPNVEYRVYSGVNSSESTFWQVPEAPQNGSHVYLGTTGELRSIWVKEFINASSDNPLYLLRTDGTPPFYITYHTTGEISLQQQVTQESYFKFELREFGGFSYRVPGTNKSIGVMNERLHVVTGRTPWYLQLPQLQCQSGGKGALVAFTLMLRPQMMWYHDLPTGFGDVFVGMQTAGIPGYAKWIVSAIQQGVVGWSIRSYDNTDFYATWIAATDPLQLYTTLNVSQDNRTFHAEYVSGTSRVKLLSPNSDKYIHIEEVNDEPDILGFSQENQATTWDLRHLGLCCGSTCWKFSFDPICEP